MNLTFFLLNHHNRERGSTLVNEKVLFFARRIFAMHMPISAAIRNSIFSKCFPHDLAEKR
jgi:hypothetical protein